MIYHRLNQILKVAGRNLVNQTIKTLGGKDECERWFNSRVMGLNWETPYDFCREGKKKRRITINRQN